MASSTNSSFLGSVSADEPIDVAGFDALMSSQIANMSQPDLQLFAASAQDIEELIADALKRRCHNQGGNHCGAALHMHLRLKKGANPDTEPIARNELADLAEMVAAKGAPNAIMKRLANFYVRIAKLRARIDEVRSADGRCGIDIAAIPHATNRRDIKHLLAAHAKNEEGRLEKQNENQRELDRIARAIVHPDLTEDDLPALEMQVEHIAERGCTTHELRRLKIVEAALEQQRYDELMERLEQLDAQ
jgi:hypothetical protein